MGAQFFGEFLLEKGAVTREMLADAATLQNFIVRPPLALGIEKGVFRPDELRALDAAFQARAAPGAAKKPFLDLSDNALTLAEALVLRGHLRLEDLCRLVQEYKKEVLHKDRQFWLYQHMRETILEGIPHRDVVSFFLQVFLEAYAAAAKENVRIAEMKENVDLRHEMDCVFSQRIEGTPRFHFALLLNEKQVLAFVSALLGQPVNTLDGLALDAVSEFLNVTTGNACRRLSMAGRQFSAEPPSVTTKAMMRKLIPGQCLAARLTGPSGPFAVMFFFEPKR